MKLIGKQNLLSGLCMMMLLVIFSGCVGKVPANHYYSLSTIEQVEPAMMPIAELDVALGIGALMVPDELKRPQIVTQSGTGQYYFNESHRWAGLLENNVSAVLGENLGRLLGTDRIGISPWLPYFKPDYRISVEVLRFDGDLSGNAMLNARWFVGNAAGDRLLASGRNEFSLPVDSPSYQNLVLAESQVLADLSRVIAEKIKSLHD